jgi:hypothetical protein
MIQQLLVVCIFAGALIYLGRLIIKNFTTKSDCAAGCGKCSVDFKKIEEQLLKK